MPRSILSVVSRVPGADTVKRAGAKVRATAARHAKKAAIGSLALAGFAGLAWMTTQARHHANDTVSSLISAAGADELAGEQAGGHVLVAAQSLVGAFDFIDPLSRPDAAQGATLAATQAVCIDASQRLVDASSSTTVSYRRCGGTFVGVSIAFMIAMVAIVRFLVHVYGPAPIVGFCDLAIWIVTVIATAIAVFTSSKQKRTIIGLVAACLFLATNMGGEGLAIQNHDARGNATPLLATHDDGWVGTFIGHALDAKSIARAIFEVGGHGAMHKIRIGGQSPNVIKLDDVLRYLRMPVPPRAADDATKLVCDAEAAGKEPFTQAGMPVAFAQSAALRITHLPETTRTIVVETLLDLSASSAERGIVLDLIALSAHGNATQLLGKLTEAKSAKSAKSAKAAKSAPHFDGAASAAVFSLIVETVMQVASGIALGLPSIVVYGSLGSPAAAKFPQVSTWKALVEGTAVTTISGTGTENQEHGTVRVIRGIFAQVAVGICETAAGIIGTNGTQATYDKETGILTLPADSGSKLDVSFFEVYEAIISPAAIDVPVLAYALALSSIDLNFDFDSVARNGAHQKVLTITAKLAALSSYLSAALSRMDRTGVAVASLAPLAIAIAETKELIDYAFRVPGQLSWVPVNQKPRVALVGALLGHALVGIYTTNASSAEQGQSAWRVVSLIPSIRNPDIRPESLTRLWTSLSPTLTELPEFTKHQLELLERGVQNTQEWYQSIIASRIEGWNKAKSPMEQIARASLADDHAAQRFYSIYTSAVKAAQDFLNLDLARKLAIQKSAGQPTPALSELNRLQKRYDDLVRAQQEIIEKSAEGPNSDPDPDLTRRIEEAVNTAQIELNDVSFAVETAEYRAAGKNEPEVAATLMAWIASRADWRTELALWISSGVFETAHIVSTLKEIMKLAPFTKPDDARFTKQVISILDAIKPAEADGTSAEACGSARTSAGKLLSSSPWLSGGGDLTEARNATKLVYEGLRKTSLDSACETAQAKAAELAKAAADLAKAAAKSEARQGIYRTTFNTRKNTLTTERSRSGMTLRGVALELMKEIRDFRPAGAPRLAPSISFDAHLDMIRSCGAVNTQEFVAFAKELLTDPHFLGKNEEFTKEVIEILETVEKGRVTTDYNKIIAAWKTVPTVVGAEDVALLSAKLLQRLNERAITRKGEEEAAAKAEAEKAKKANDDRFNAKIEAVTRQFSTPQKKASYLLAWIAMGPDGVIADCPWHVQVGAWVDSGLLTLNRIGDALLGSIIRRVAELPRFTVGHNPEYTKRVIAMLPPDPATVGKVDVASITPVINKLAGVLDTCQTQNAGPETAAAQACAATQLIVDMLNFAIEKQQSKEGAAFGARRAIKRPRGPRRFL
jgi:hypothetical protein